MELLVTLIILGFLSAWFIISLVFQFSSKVKSKVAEHDVFGLIPSWSFFAPIPGTSDYRLVYRDYKQNETFSEWSEVSFYKKFSLLRVVWNPQKVEIKALSDVCQIFLKEVTSDFYKANPALLRVTTSYIALLSKVCNEPKPYDSRERQFAILTSTGFNEKRKVIPLFVSSPHELN